MIQIPEVFKEQFNNHLIKLPYKNLIEEIKCYLITESNNNLDEIEKLPNKSQIISIDKSTEEGNTYYFICFDKAIIIVSESKIPLLSNFFKKEKNSIKINASEKVKSDNILREIGLNITYDINETEKEEYKETIDNFIEQVKLLKKADIKIQKIWTLILPCLTTYFINKSYQNYKTRKISEKTIKITKMNHDEFIPLQLLNLTNSSRIQLIYHIEREQLLVLKSFYSSESKKLFEREYKNYSKISHPSIPRFYGMLNIDDKDSLIVEYIRGTNLAKIDKLSLGIQKKINIIFEIMIVIEYLQNHNFIYRDLKPSNFIIDSRKLIKLIDFDRMVLSNETELDNVTTDFNNMYQAPEVLNGTVKKYTFEEDVYSIGLLVYFIIFERNPKILNNESTNQKMYSFHEFPKEFLKLKKICEQCTRIEPEKRPKIAILIEFFINHFLAEFNKLDFTDLFNNHEIEYKNLNNTTYIEQYEHHININHRMSIFRIGMNYYPTVFTKNNQFEYHDCSLCYLFFGLYYYDGKYIPRDINRAINYLTLSADKNNSIAQFNLGVIYHEGTYVKRDINKSINYFTLASKQNDISSQFNLGKIYSDGLLIPIDIDKAIYYYTLCALQNYAEAQFQLGLIFFEGQYVIQDINKAIHYFTQAANQNHVQAQFNLGLIFSDDKYAKVYINKAIYYYTLASNQNYSDAQCNLGFIYLQDKYVPRDVNKAIYYFTLAANLKNACSQYNLGMIYYEGKYIERDVNKGIYYLTLAAEQNIEIAQFNLGFIFSEGQYVNHNINKAIYYYTLAANQNNVNAQYNLGLIYYNGKNTSSDINKAIKYLTQAANQNHIIASLFLGFIYYERKYVPTDIKNAIRYLSFAANKNNEMAQNLIGAIYYDGEYVKRDMNKAIYYFTLAAEQNYVDAQFNLGLIYYEAKYVTRDMNKAIHYFTLAAEKNDVKAQFNLGFIYSNGYYIEKDINKGIHYFTLAANQNFVEAQFNLGIIYYGGKYTEKNINKAMHYLSLAANNNYVNAQHMLSIIYYEGKYIERDVNKAIHYLTLAAKQKYEDAQINLGFIYYEGKYIAKDVDKAIHYLTLAADQNNDDAQNNLGAIYFKEKDINKAIHYFTLAANQNNSKAQYNLGMIYSRKEFIQKYLNKAIYYFEISANKGNANSQLSLSYIYYIGKYVPRDINKAIYYAKLASNHDNPGAQCLLGYIYIDTKQNIKNGIDYLIMASNKMQYGAHFYAGFIFHEGKYVDKDIKKAIHFYKEGSSFNDKYSKNNLGVIYINGYGDEIKSNIGLAIKYFTEAIKQKNDIASMYNLANIYIYDERIQHNFDKAIELLVKSSNEKFSPSYYLLVIALIKKIGLNSNLDFIKEIEKYDDITNSTKNEIFEIFEILEKKKLYLSEKFECMYNVYKNCKYLYNFNKDFINSEMITIGKDANSEKKSLSISPEFYEGFDIGEVI